MHVFFVRKTVGQGEDWHSVNVVGCYNYVLLCLRLRRILLLVMLLLLLLTMMLMMMMLRSMSVRRGYRLHNRLVGKYWTAELRASDDVRIEAHSRTGSGRCSSEPKQRSWRLPGRTSDVQHRNQHCLPAEHVQWQGSATQSARGPIHGRHHQHRWRHQVSSHPQLLTYLIAYLLTYLQMILSLTSC